MTMAVTYRATVIKTAGVLSMIVKINANGNLRRGGGGASLINPLIHIHTHTSSLRLKCTVKHSK